MSVGISVQTNVSSANRFSVKNSMPIRLNQNFHKSPGHLTTLQNRVVNISHHDLLLTSLLELNGCLKLKEKRRQKEAAMTGIRPLLINEAMRAVDN